MKKPKIICPPASRQMGGVERMYVNAKYGHGIDRARGRLIIPLLYPHQEDIEDTMGDADGLLLQGGADIDPRNYGQKDTGCKGILDSRRDELEIAMVRYALNRYIPILAICRGMQILNVATGGSLRQHLDGDLGELHTRDSERERSFLAHPVYLKEKNILFRACNTLTLAVNSLHHQAIDKLGSGLIVEARSADGIIEAVSCPDHVFCIGVQYHPEETLEKPSSQELFNIFVDVARKFQAER